MSKQKHTPEKCEPSPLGLQMRPILIRNDEMELLGASTPGPWKTDEEEYSQYVFGPDGEMICEMRGWGYLTGNRRKLSEKEAMKIQAANCKLIARAPELLQQVSALTKENERLKKENRWFKDWRKLIDAIIPPGPMCRDCADGDGTCDSDGLPCDPTDRAIVLLSRLREREKELLEALRELYKQQPTMLTLIPDAALDFLDLPKKATLLKVESLLSKEV